MNGNTSQNQRYYVCLPFQNMNIIYLKPNTIICAVYHGVHTLPAILSIFDKPEPNIVEYIIGILDCC